MAKRKDWPKYSISQYEAIRKHAVWIRLLGNLLYYHAVYGQRNKALFDILLNEIPKYVKHLEQELEAAERLRETRKNKSPKTPLWVTGAIDELFDICEKILAYIILLRATEKTGNWLQVEVIMTGVNDTLVDIAQELNDENFLSYIEKRKDKMSFHDLMLLPELIIKSGPVPGGEENTTHYATLDEQWVSEFRAEMKKLFKSSDIQEDIQWQSM